MHIEPEVETVEGPLRQRKVDQAQYGMRMRKALMTGTAVHYRIREAADLGLESVQRNTGNNESALCVADAAAAAEMVGRVGRERTAMQVMQVLSSIACFAGHTVVVAVAVEEVGRLRILWLLLLLLIPLWLLGRLYPRCICILRLILLNWRTRGVRNLRRLRLSGQFRRRLVCRRCHLGLWCPLAIPVNRVVACAVTGIGLLVWRLGNGLWRLQAGMSDLFRE